MTAGLGVWGDEPEPVVAEDAAEEPAPLYFNSLDEFVREMIVPVFRRRVGARAGAKQWDKEWLA